MMDALTRILDRLVPFNVTPELEALASTTTIGGGKKRISQAQLKAGKVAPQFHHVSRQVKRAAQRKRLKAMAGGLR